MKKNLYGSPRERRKVCRFPVGAKGVRRFFGRGVSSPWLTCFLGGALALVVSSCSVYKPQPVDFYGDAARWRRLSESLCATGKPLSRQELRNVGLLLNPELNRSRMAYAKSTETARFAGLWEDPSFSGELEHVLRRNLNNYALSPGLTIPVTGLPRLSRLVAEQYREADYWKMCAEERLYLQGLDALICRVLTTHRKHELMERRLKELREEKEQLSGLQRMGEISFADYQVACQRLFDTEKEFQELTREHQDRHSELTSMLGLHPNARHLEIDVALPEPVGASVPAPEVLAEAPSLKAELAAYGATEEELRLEIRKQYPELGISPSRAREEGNAKLGVGVELNIPLWNRNRGGIARAHGDRALQWRQVIAQWRSMLMQAASLQDKQRLALQHCRTAREHESRLAEAAARQEKLYEMGETSLPALAEARHEFYQRRLNYLDCLGELYAVQIPLQYLNPFFES